MANWLVGNRLPRDLKREIEMAAAEPVCRVRHDHARQPEAHDSFRTERLDMTRPSLHEAATASFEGLATAVSLSRNENLTGQALETLSLDQAAAIARAWSLVHGFTTLLLDGRLKDILHRLPEGTGVEQLLDAMLRSTVPRPPVMT